MQRKRHRKGKPAKLLEGRSRNEGEAGGARWARLGLRVGWGDRAMVGVGQMSPPGASEAVMTWAEGEIGIQVLQCVRKRGRGFSAWLPLTSENRVDESLPVAVLLPGDI